MKKKPIEELVERYVEATGTHGRLTEISTRESTKAANKLYDAIRKIYKDLRTQYGQEAEAAIVRLLEHPDAGVRVWAAIHALEYAPAAAERVLTELEKVPKSFIAIDARMTLREWRAGRLKFNR